MMEKIIKILKKYKIVLISLLLLLIVVFIIFQKRTYISHLETKYYTIQYDSTWKMKLKEETKITLKHRYSDAKIVAEIVSLSQESQYNSIDELIDEISYNGSGGFYCLYGDSLKINIITDFPSSSNTAIKNNNKYTWNPTSASFKMDFKLLKTREEIEKKYPEYDENYDKNGQVIPDSNTDNTDNTDAIDIGEDADSNNNTGVIIAIVFVGASIIFIIALIILKNKKNKLNRI